MIMHIATAIHLLKRRTKQVADEIHTIKNTHILHPWQVQSKFLRYMIWKRLIFWKWPTFGQPWRNVVCEIVSSFKSTMINWQFHLHCLKDYFLRLCGKCHFSLVGMFVCNDSTSILDYTSICDLSPDCVDGSDENDCRELFYTLWNLFLQLDCFCILNSQETKSEEKKVTVLEIYLFMIIIHREDIGSFFSLFIFPSIAL